MSPCGQSQLVSKLCVHPGARAPVSRPPRGSGAPAHPCGRRLGAPARRASPGQAPLPAGVPTSLVLIGGCMQTPVVSSFMGRESGGEQREWAQWGALAGSACSQGEERRGGGGGERWGGGRGDKGGGKERKTAQCKTDLSTPALQPASPAACFRPLADWRLVPPAALLSPPSLLLSGPHLSPPPSERSSTSKPQPGGGG